MIDAKLLATPPSDGGDAPPAVSIYGVWIPRRGDNARFTLELPANYGTDFTAALYTKNYDEVGDGTPTGLSIVFAAGATGRQTLEVLGVKEVLRFRITLAAELEEGLVGWVLFRLLQPVWFESIKV